ncbi:DUF6087 family protein [Streptomyces goshikiensis]
MGAGQERRDSFKGNLRVTALAPGPHRGSHVQPDAPRLVEE